MEALKPSEVLSRAADLIEPEGAWCQGGASNAPNREALAADATAWCGWGAIARAMNSEATHRVFTYLDRATGGPSAIASPSKWGQSFNDAPDRTQAEVVAALRKASDLARSEGQ